MMEFFWISIVPLVFGLAAFFEPYTTGVHKKFLTSMNKLDTKQFAVNVFLFLFSRVLFFCIFGALVAILRYYFWFYISLFAIGVIYVIIAIANFMYAWDKEYPTINPLKTLKVPLWVTYAAVVPAISLPLCITLSLFIFFTGIIGVGIFSMMMFSTITSVPILLLLFFPKYAKVWAKPAKKFNRFYITTALILAVAYVVMLTNLS